MRFFILQMIFEEINLQEKHCPIVGKRRLKKSIYLGLRSWVFMINFHHHHFCRNFAEHQEGRGVVSRCLYDEIWWYIYISSSSLISFIYEDHHQHNHHYCRNFCRKRGRTRRCQQVSRKSPADSASYHLPSLRWLWWGKNMRESMTPVWCIKENLKCFKKG